MYQNEKMKEFKVNKNQTYREMHLDILNNDGKNACNFNDSIKCLELINNIQQCGLYKCKLN